MTSVLKLSDAVDDTVWASDSTGAIYTADKSADTVNRVRTVPPMGRLRRRHPCDANGAPGVCPDPGSATTSSASSTPGTGKITAVAVTGATVAQGAVLVS